jgi:hypothetical protein
LPVLKQTAETMPLSLVYWGAALTIIVVMVAYRWRHKPKFMRVALAILPIFLVLYVFWGYPLEIRVMLEVYPIVAILMLPPPGMPRNAIAAANIPLS